MNREQAIRHVAKMMDRGDEVTYDEVMDEAARVLVENYRTIRSLSVNDLMGLAAQRHFGFNPR